MFALSAILYSFQQSNKRFADFNEAYLLFTFKSNSLTTQMCSRVGVRNNIQTLYNKQ